MTGTARRTAAPISRRTMLAAPLAIAASLSAAAANDRAGQLAEMCDAIERRHGGRLGVALLDTAAPPAIAHRGDERFPLCSTFKVLAAAFILAEVDAGRETLDRRIRYGRADLVPYSPVTGRHAGEAGLTLGEICKAAITLSDNTAGNLMLDRIGGPGGLTARLRALGDEVTRLDRREPDLNTAIPGDPRDTTSPPAMLATLRRLLLAEALGAASRARLTDWLVANETGGRRLRAGLPAGWRVGDKTGSGDRGTTNDVAILWPPDRPPILVAAYYTGADAPDAMRDAVLAEIGRFAARG